MSVSKSAPTRWAVTDGNGRRVDRRDAKLAPGDPLTWSSPCRNSRPASTPRANALISSDTHPLNGEVRFGVDVSPADLLAGSAATGEAPLDTPLLLQAIGRGLNLLGLILLIGPIAFRLFVLVPPWARGRGTFGGAARLFESRGVRWAWIAVTVLIIGQIVALVSASLASTFGAFTDAFGLSNLLGTLSRPLRHPLARSARAAAGPGARLAGDRGRIGTARR
jgi:hypothetical protein